MELLDRLDRCSAATGPWRCPSPSPSASASTTAAGSPPTVSYYSFFSVFPLMLVFVTVLGHRAGRRPDLREDLVDGALGRIPLIGTQLAAADDLDRRQRVGARDRVGDGALGGHGGGERAAGGLDELCGRAGAPAARTSS